MKIEKIVSVTTKTVVTINGVEHILHEGNHTESIKDAHADCKFKNADEIIDYFRCLLGRLPKNK